MVTSDNKNLAELIKNSSDRRWDLLDMTKRAAWMISTKAKLRADAEAWLFMSEGPVTPERVVPISGKRVPDQARFWWTELPPTELAVRPSASACGPPCSWRMTKFAHLASNPRQRL